MLGPKLSREKCDIHCKADFQRKLNPADILPTPASSCTLLTSLLGVKDFPKT
jgi:hypothetical protein